MAVPPAVHVDTICTGMQHGVLSGFLSGFFSVHVCTLGSIPWLAARLKECTSQVAKATSEQGLHACYLQG